MLIKSSSRRSSPFSSYSSSYCSFLVPHPHHPPHHLAIGFAPTPTPTPPPLPPLGTPSYTQSNLNAEWREANDALSKSEGRRRKLLLVLLQAKRFLAHAVTHSPDMFMGVIWNIDRDFKTAIVGIPKQRKQTGMVIRKEFEAELEYAFVRALCCL